MGHFVLSEFLFSSFYSFSSLFVLLICVSMYINFIFFLFIHFILYSISILYWSCGLIQTKMTITIITETRCSPGKWGGDHTGRTEKDHVGHSASGKKYTASIHAWGDRKQRWRIGNLYNNNNNNNNNGISIAPYGRNFRGAELLSCKKCVCVSVCVCV